MGIKGLSQFIKKKYPHVLLQVPLTLLKGKRIAVDAYGWMFSNMSTTRKEVLNKTDVYVEDPNPIEIRRLWLGKAVAFVITWLSYGVTPIFVFDGEHLDQKSDTKKDRYEKSQATREAIAELKTRVRGLDVLDVRPHDVTELRKLMRNDICISKDNSTCLKTMLSCAGIPCIQATDEAERLCAMMCVEGKVAAVYSKDSDCMAWGCPLQLKEFSRTYAYDDKGNRVHQCEAVRLDKVLEALDMPYYRFIDLCIMSGNDFNDNIPKIACVKSYNLLQQYDNIDNIAHLHDISILKHKVGRSIFRRLPSEVLTVGPIQELEELPDDFRTDLLGNEIVSTEISLNVSKNCLHACGRDILESYGLGSEAHKLARLYSVLPASTPGHPEELEIEVPKYDHIKSKSSIKLVLV